MDMISSGGKVDTSKPSGSEVEADSSMRYQLTEFIEENL